VKSIAPTHEFRRRLGEILGTLAAPLVDTWLESGGDLEGIDKEALLRKMLPLLLCEGVDAFVDMLWLYAPELQEFEAGATPEEVLAAAMEVLDAAFPLVLLVGKQTVALLSRAGITFK
ncbi:hypothetical protein LCGC14_2907400, partial [marine sediment metagenome]